MTDKEYQIGLSTLFVGYVLMQVPSNALLNYAGRPSWYIGFFVRSESPFLLSLSVTTSLTSPTDLRLGLGLRRDQPSKKCRGNHRLPIHPGFRRGALLPRYSVLLIQVVHQGRTVPPYGYLLFGLARLRRFW